MTEHTHWNRNPSQAVRRACPACCDDEPDTVRGKVLEARALREQAQRLLVQAGALETAAMLQDERETRERQTRRAR